MHGGIARWGRAVSSATGWKNPHSEIALIKMASRILGRQGELPLKILQVRTRGYWGRPPTLGVVREKGDPRLNWLLLLLIPGAVLIEPRHGRSEDHELSDHRCWHSN